MFVFLLAGSEVVLSAVVLATCNFLFIKKKPSVPEDKLESVAFTADSKTREHSESAEVNDEQEEEEEERAVREKQEEETIKEEQPEDELRPKSAMVNSEEVEKFLKEPEQNGSIDASPETCL